LGGEEAMSSAGGGEGDFAEGTETEGWHWVVGLGL
jgi:hypothetical protein